VQGLQFKAIRLDFAVGGSGVTPANRRSLLAHWCFGSMALANLAEDPFTFGADFTGLDTIGPSDLTPCELPLAVFSWTGSAIEFLDNWSARRRITRTDPHAAWAGLLSDKRVAISQARFLQFQERVDELMKTGAASNTAAAAVFGLLPPVGFLPLKPASVVARLDAIAGSGKIKKPQRPTKPVFFGAATAAKEPTGMVMLAQATNQKMTIAPEMLQLGGAFSDLFDQVQDLHDAFADAFARIAPPPADAPPKEPSKASAERQAKRDRARMAEVNGLRGGLMASGSVGGFDLVKFFGALPTRIGVIDRETVDFTLQRSWFDEAINLAVNPVINVFVVRESLGKKGVQPYVIFAKAVHPITWISLGSRKV
jgi:hypothetical protein